MFDIAGGAALINKAASMAATQAGKKVANKALTKTVWYPVVKKVAAMLGQKITRQTVGSAVTKVVPVLGVVSQARLPMPSSAPWANASPTSSSTTSTAPSPKKDLKNELNPEFLKELEEQDELARV